MLNQDKSRNKIFIPSFQRSLLYMLVAVLTALFPTACSETGTDSPEDPDFEEGIPTEVRITLSARSNNATRADRDGVDRDPVSSVELIHNWWIVFVDLNGKVTLIKDTDIPTADKIRSTPSSVSAPDNGFEAETFKIILPSGTYRIYAFANVPAKTESEFKGYLKKDSNGKWGHTTVKLPKIIGDENGFLKNSNSNNNKMQWDASVNIPMSGVMTNKIIKNTVEEAFNIEVIRAVAKVEFVFKNPSTEDITLTKLDFSPISDYEKLSFIPNNDSVGFAPNTKIITDKVDTGTMTFDLGSTKLTTANQNHSFSFYCNESLPHDQKKYNDNQEDYDNSKKYTDLYTGHFTIDLKIERNGKEESKTLLTKKIYYINRNDWIFIPIEFAEISDWTIYWKLRAYPPIGGYPPVFEQNEDGTSLSARVTTGGEFELYPYLIKKGGGEDWAGNVDWENDITVTIESGQDLFVKKPEKDAAAKAIFGELDPKKTGTAKVKIDFYLQESTNIAQKLTCLFTIHRQNSAPTQSTQ